MIDGKLNTPEETKAFLEPYSPPAPPPQITIKRSRAKRAEKIKEKSFDDEEEVRRGRKTKKTSTTSGAAVTMMTKSSI